MKLQVADELAPRDVGFSLSHVKGRWPIATPQRSELQYGSHYRKLLKFDEREMVMHRSGC
jgi:hypothetical protein